MRLNLLQMSSRLADRYFELGQAAQFTLWLALILLIKFDTILAPPVWDAAMGVFPPAIFLYETGFDLSALVQQPDWWEGGPNVTVFSLLTWIIAVVMSISDSPTITFAILHIITFMINALAISTLLRILHQYDLAPHLVLISGAFLLLMPLVLVQIGYIYTESLVMSLSVLAWASWHEDREGRAVLFALIAIATKLTGVVIALCLAMLLILRLLRKFSYKRLVLLLSLPLTLLIMLSAYSWFGGSPSEHGMNWGSQQAIFNQLLWRMAVTTEITNLIYLGGFAALGFGVYQSRLNPETNPVDFMSQLSAENGSRLIALVYTPLFSIGIIVMSFAGVLFLHRYAVPMIPFAIIQLALFAQVLKFQRELSLVLFIGCLVSILNHNGDLYTPASAFSIVEASHAYKPYVVAQKTMIEEIGKLGDDLPIFVSREIDYMTSHPMMGYLDDVNSAIKGIYKPQYEGISLEDLPDEFFVAVTSRGHGGKRLNQIIDNAKRSTGWLIEHIYGQNIGGYNMHIKRVSNTTQAKNKFQSDHDI